MAVCCSMCHGKRGKESAMHREGDVDREMRAVVPLEAKLDGLCPSPLSCIEQCSG